MPPRVEVCFRSASIVLLDNFLSTRFDGIIRLDSHSLTTFMNSVASFLNRFAWTGVGVTLLLTGLLLAGFDTNSLMPPLEISNVEASAVTVTFGGAEAPIQDVATTRIEAEVPEEASDGPVKVTVGEEAATGPEFDVIPPAPMISNVQPTGGQSGTTVTITGSNFGTESSEVSVTFDGAVALVQNVTSTEIETEVPGNASDGPVEVTVDQKTATGPEFDVIPPGQITYLQDNAVYVSKPDGSDAEQVTNIGNEALPTLSADGSLVAFQSYDGNDWKIYTVWTNGTSLRQLTSDPADELGPGWAPDDSRLAFSSDRSGDAEIYTMNSDGDDLERVTIDDARDISADWSPDGTRIAFESNRDGDREIYTINPNGANLRQLTTNSVGNYSPDWSPDGSKIAFHGEQSDGNLEIYIVDVENKGLKQVTFTSTARNRLPAWSPDGDRIVFESDRSGETAIYTIRPDGTDLKRINEGIQPDWGPSSQ